MKILLFFVITIAVYYFVVVDSISIDNFFSNSDLSSSNKNKKGFIFLKTHKTGSSSVTMIILRKCIKEKWNCYIPPLNHPGHTYDMNDENDITLLKNGQGLNNGKHPYDLWCHHIINNKNIYKSNALVNNYNGIAITILRRPAERFRSAWSWYSHGMQPLSSHFHEFLLSNSYTKYKLLFGHGSDSGSSSSSSSSSSGDFSKNFPKQYRHSAKFGMNLTTFVDSLGRVYEKPSHHHINNNKNYNKNYKNSSSSNIFINHNLLKRYRERFVYRTGLDATTQELLGTKSKNIDFYSSTKNKNVQLRMTSSTGSTSTATNDNNNNNNNDNAPIEFDDLLHDIETGKLYAMILDRFDESLVVLSYILGWPLDDMSYSYDYPHRTKTYTNGDDLNNDQKRVLDALQPLDLALYNAANAKLDQYLRHINNLNQNEKSRPRPSPRTTKKNYNDFYKIRNEEEGVDNGNNIQIELGLGLESESIIQTDAKNNQLSLFQKINQEKNDICKLLNTSSTSTTNITTNISSIETEQKRMCKLLMMDNKEYVRLYSI